MMIRVKFDVDSFSSLQLKALAFCITVMFFEDPKTKLYVNIKMYLLKLGPSFYNLLSSGQLKI